MSEKLRESLSAAVDGEADEFELRRVLDELPKDALLRSAWSRYHLIGAVVRSERMVSRSLRERVWAELDLEAADMTPVPEVQPAAAGEDRGRAPWASLAGMAVAAAVAFAVVLVGIESGVDEESAGPAVVASAPVAPPTTGGVVLTRAMTPQERDHIQSLMLRHTQQLGMNQPGLAAFTKMVTYQRQ